MVKHPIPPTYDSSSRILILGSFPSVKSREEGYFYAHPQNRFWKLLSALFEESCPQSLDEKRDFLLRRHIALWDVIASCEISGSADSSIAKAEPNDIRRLLAETEIRAVYVNGRTADRLYRKYIEPMTSLPAHYLPSTSPANAAWKLQDLLASWNCILEHL